MTAPSWSAATAGFATQAGQVNQFLVSHAVTCVYQGALQASQQTAGSGYADSDALWIAQSFTTAAGQTAIGYVVLNAGVQGSPAPWVFSLQANSAGAPSGTPLVSTAVPKEFVAGGAGGPFTVMLPVTGLTASTTYWIVAQAAGDGSDNYYWAKSNQTSGASTSPDGVTWTAQSYGLLFKVLDQSPAAPLAGTWEDSGARWTALSYTSGQLTGIDEYTAGQAANGYTVSSRTLTYTGNQLAKVA